MKKNKTGTTLIQPKQTLQFHASFEAKSYHVKKPYKYLII